MVREKEPTKNEIRKEGMCLSIYILKYLGFMHVAGII